MFARKKQILYRILNALWFLAVVVVGGLGLIIVFAGFTNANVQIQVGEPVNTMIRVIGIVGFVSGIVAGVIKPKRDSTD